MTDKEKCQKCACGYHPFFDKDKFDFLIDEFGILDKVISLEEVATCKTCKDSFKRNLKEET